MIAVVGLGLIGTSLGLAWRRAGAARTLIGIDPDPTARAVARDRGAVDVATADLAAVAGAEVVVLAAPPTAVLDLAPDLAAVVTPGTVVTDVCSVKAAVVERYEAVLPPAAGGRASFVGGHPMAGAAASGGVAADADLFAGRPWILTPTPATDPDALARVAGLARAAGARVVHLAPDEHDRRVARVSHLPQMVATALMLAAAGAEVEPAGGPGLAELAGPGLRDTTRIAGSPGALWADVLTLNAEAVLAAVHDFRQHLDRLVQAVERGDGQAVRALIDAGARARRRLEEVR